MSAPGAKFTQMSGDVSKNRVLPIENSVVSLGSVSSEERICFQKI